MLEMVTKKDSGSNHQTDYPHVVLGRDSTSRYRIGQETYGIASRSQGIHARTAFDLRDAGIEAGRAHYEQTKRLPGQITVRQVGKKIDVKVD